MRMGDAVAGAGVDVAVAVGFPPLPALTRSIDVEVGERTLYYLGVRASAALTSSI